jgi:hypothetical protein
LISDFDFMFRSLSRRRQLKSRARSITPQSNIENHSKTFLSQMKSRLSTQEVVEVAKNDLLRGKFQISRLRSPSKTTRPTRNVTTHIRKCCCEQSKRFHQYYRRLQMQDIQTQNRQDCEIIVEKIRPKKLNKCHKCKMKKCLCTSNNLLNGKIESQNPIHESKCVCKRKPKQSHFTDEKKVSLKGILVTEN